MGLDPNWKITPKGRGENPLSCSGPSRNLEACKFRFWLGVMSEIWRGLSHTVEGLDETWEIVGF